MKVLVLGHTGMLGRDITDELGGCHDVIGKAGKDFDITSFSDCRDTIGQAKADVVINATASTTLDGCDTDKNGSSAVNAEGVKNAALACREWGCRLVHFSTGDLFNGTKNTPYVEDDPCNPVSAYGRGKLMGEEYLREITDNYLIIRTAWLYGKHGRILSRQS